MFGEYFWVSDSDMNFKRARAHKKWQFGASSKHEHTLFRAGTSEYWGFDVQHNTTKYLQIFNQFLKIVGWFILEIIVKIMLVDPLDPIYAKVLFPGFF